MRKFYLAVGLISGLSFNAATQTCGDVFTDSGGAGSDYSNDELQTYTICPPNSSQTILLDFTAFLLEDGYDYLTIYNGNSTSAPEIGSYTGTTSPGSVIATNPSGCLTLVFESDGSVTELGWIANVSCVNPVTCFPVSGLTSSAVTHQSASLSWTVAGSENQWEIEYGPSGFTPGTGTTTIANSNPFTLNGLSGSSIYNYYVRAICGASDTSIAAGPASFETTLAPFECGNIFVDEGGISGNYLNSSIDTVTICRSTFNETLMVIFTEFGTEDGYDSLMIFDGNGLNGTLIGTFQGTNSPDTITSSSGCLTFLFMSDGSVTSLGWVADIVCQQTGSLSEKEENFIQVFPNPSSGIIKVNNLKNENLSLSLHDLNGRKVELPFDRLNSLSVEELDLSHLENGSYFLRVSSGQHAKTYAINIVK